MPGTAEAHPGLARLVLGLLVAGWVSSAGALASAAEPDAGSAAAEAQGAAKPEYFAIYNPGSIAEQYAQDRARKEYLFRIPGAESVFEPWSDLRAQLNEKYGFRPTISFTHIYQWASDSVGPEDDASGYELVFDFTWTALGRDTDSPTVLGFEFLQRDKLGGEIPPVALFTQAGSLYPTTVAFGDIGPTVGQLWLQQIFKGQFGFRVGKFFPLSAYDFFPLKNFRTDFVDGIHAANLVIPLPDRGLGAFAMYRPRPNIYLRLGVHDANADTERSGFHSIDEKEFFTIFEVGFDPGLMERQEGRPAFGDVHLSLWHMDEHDDDNVDDGWGFVVSGSQRFGRFLPFLRYGYSDSGSGGPAIIEHVVNAGVAIDNIFGQSNDRIGIGLTWSRPAASALDDQGALDAFYRVQVTPRIAVTPMLQLIIDPVRNPDEDAVWVLGVRSRFAF